MTILGGKKIMSVVEQGMTDAQMLALLGDLPDFLGSGARLADLNGQSSEQTSAQLEAAYAYAYGLYQQKRYGEAGFVFAFLTVQDHLDVRYWSGLGGAQQMQAQYKEAIDSYGMVVMYDLGNPMPCYRIAECLMALGEYDDAELVLKTVIEFANTDSDEHTAIKHRVASVTALLESARQKAQQGRDTRKSDSGK